jgi:hypothetical protein
MGVVTTVIPMQLLEIGMSFGLASAAFFCCCNNDAVMRTQKMFDTQL